MNKWQITELKELLKDNLKIKVTDLPVSKSHKIELMWDDKVLDYDYITIGWEIGNSHC